MRWEHPVRGLLGPEEFIPHAEQTGLVVELGAVVLDRACAVTAAWNTRRDQPLGVSVNLSARQLAHPALTDVVGAALERSGLPPALLCLEVTETVVMEDPVASGLVLATLREMGVRVAVDDFGTGYSSLAYLLSLPVDVLKVDRSFVSAVGEGSAGVAIVSAVLALARTLQLGVVAEGVETLEQRQVLLGLGVNAAQGWLWGRAVPADDARWARSGGPLVASPGLPAARRPRDVELPDRLVGERSRP